MNGRRRFARKIHAAFNNVLTLDVQRIENHDRNALTFGIQGSRNSFRRALQHTGELIHRNYVIVPGKLVCLRSGSTCCDVVKMPAHDQGPCIIQALKRISTCTKPHGGN